MNFTIVPVHAARDAPLLHDWMVRDYARFWGMTTASRAEVEAEYTRIAEDPHHHAWLGLEDGTPAFLMESYAPAHSPLAGLYEVRPGDTGMHLLVGPAEQPRSGFTTAVFRSVLDFLFAQERTQRIVVEPDVRNTKIAALNARMGFVPAKTISLPDKDALLSFCTRGDYARSRQSADAAVPAAHPTDAVSGVAP
ncbi:GNAT family N-acetyltransferase [Arthrobacter sp. zg-Y1219]|uniref:GNAT family N-acetyltransferase n=1 Tax=Arthrobacter sp. zg-Y1219 TaxID=3049067 RepID=UPI0024C40E64|nr:GNAT family N-acetyltransferase [Arthrobacter sp. zg-Y1219]MDK1361504.1 GNAT family N-acetyltransferase [Arthrobacter sp. zg-Y1219]